MMEVRYKRDLKNSYLILPVDEEAVKSYQMQMITKNRIEGLLSCQLKTEEDNRVCYYEISSRQSLQHMYMRNEMGYEELKNLLTGIYLVLQKLDKYLLHSTCLILEPEYIYMDIERGSICLVYLPGYNEDSFVAIQHLAEYVLSRVNHADQYAVKLAYYFYQCSREENFSFQHLTEYIERQNEQLSSVVQKDFAEEESCEMSYSPVSAADTDAEDEDAYVCDMQKECCEADANTVGTIMQKRVLYAGVAGTIAIAAVCIFVFLNYRLQTQEIAIGAGLIAVFYAALIMAYVHYGRMDRKQAAEVPSEQLPAWEYPYENIQTEEKDYGNTVFFGHEAAVVHNFLEGEYKGNQLRFEIDKEQIMIGKMKGKVDIELSDMSVSRIHAEIYQRGDKVWLKDLNSTNGTYKNGVILQPEETVELKSLDEIRFGKICLTYH